MSPGQCRSCRAMVSINTGTSARSVAGAAAQSACARGCYLLAGCAAGGACARPKVLWIMARVCAASKGCSTTAPVTMRTHALTSPSPAPSRTAAFAGAPCHYWPCSSPACCATSRPKPVSAPASAATTGPHDPAVGAKTQSQAAANPCKPVWARTETRGAPVVLVAMFNRS